jgi:predicted nuclease of restriction endonuclease-like RecB superfamily
MKLKEMREELEHLADQNKGKNIQAFCEITKALAAVSQAQDIAQIRKDMETIGQYVSNGCTW